MMTIRQILDIRNQEFGTLDKDFTQYMLNGDSFSSKSRIIDGSDVFIPKGTVFVVMDEYDSEDKYLFDRQPHILSEDIIQGPGNKVLSSHREISGKDNNRIKFFRKNVMKEAFSLDKDIANIDNLFHYKFRLDSYNWFIKQNTPKKEETK